MRLGGFAIWHPQENSCTGQLVLFSFVSILTTGCGGTLPSSNVQQRAFLPVPPSTDRVTQEAESVPSAERPRVRVSARSVIPTAFELHPDIKASYQRFRAEEARYDFFYVSRDTLTPRLQVVSSYEEEGSRSVTGRRIYDRTSGHTLEAAIEKEFFDTTRIEVGTGVNSSRENGDDGYQPFVFAGLRYPLGGSRERLARTSEDIFRRNELDDAQLEYIDNVRERLSDALEQFYEVIELQINA